MDKYLEDVTNAVKAAYLEGALSYEVIAAEVRATLLGLIEEEEDEATLQAMEADGTKDLDPTH